MKKLCGAEIVGIGRAIPKKKLTNHDLEKMVDTSDDWIVTRTGIRERYVISGDESVSDMGVEAARQALTQAGVNPQQVDLIVVGTFSADYRLPSCACLIQDKLGATRAGAFDINSACTGFINSFLTGAQFLKSGSSEYVLVVGADAASRMIDWTDRNVCVLFGDGASAVLLKRSENTEVGVQSHYVCTDGSGMCSLWIPAGGSSRPLTESLLQERAQYVKMAGKDVFKFAIQAISDSALNVLDQEGLTPRDINLMIPHQANIRIINAAARRLGLTEEQVVINIDKYGNTVSASVGLAMYDAFHEGRLKPGDRVLIVGFGAGLSWGATLVNWSLPCPN
jgi:3-oxoacyl-[acyl-carrier-protein] synthase III